jgi:alginate production protein
VKARHHRRITLLLAAVLALPCLSAAQGAGVVTPAQPGTLPAPAHAADRRIDDRRPAEPLHLLLGTTLVKLSGNWEYSDERRRNFDLQDSRARDRRVREHEVKLEAQAELRPGLRARVQAVLLHETRHTQGTAHALKQQALERGEMWLQWDQIQGTPWSLQLGRVPLVERRSLWWDDDVDALRLRYAQGPWQLDAGLARTLLRVSSAEPGIAPEERGVWRQWGEATWRYAPRHLLEARWLWASDRSGTPAVGSTWPSGTSPDTSDLEGRWAGLRASGEWRAAAADGTRLGYWAEAVLLRGRERRTAFSSANAGAATAGASASRALRGHAIDLGLSWTLGLPLRPSLTLAHARGSGGRDDPTQDRNFRQTGLHENKVRLAGVKRLRRYGELFQPDLSNLAVTTLGAGLRLLGKSSLELVLHRYRQAVPATHVEGARLSTQPEGLHTALGRELDLVVAVREWSWLELTLRWSRFEPGAAYGPNGRNPAQAVELGAEMNF